MANVDNANGFSWAGNIYGSSIGPLTKAIPQASTIQINEGDFVIYVNGTVGLGLANSTHLLGVAAQTQLSTSALEPILVVVARPGDLFEGQCEGTPSQASIGIICDIINGTGVMEIDENAHLTGAIQIMELVDDGNNVMGEFARMLVSVVVSDYMKLKPAHL